MQRDVFDHTQGFNRKENELQFKVSLEINQYHSQSYALKLYLIYYELDIDVFNSKNGLFLLWFRFKVT